MNGTIFRSRKSKIGLLVICLILAVSLLVLSQTSKAFVGVPDTEDAKQIQDVILRSCSFAFLWFMRNFRGESRHIWYWTFAKIEVSTGNIW